MKIFALNGMQSHSDIVKRNVALLGKVVLRGYAVDGTIQLLEGSHRMAYAVELGVPITIVLFGENEVIPHDCDDMNSKETGLIDRSTVGELADSLVKERGLYHQGVYESDDHPNVVIVDASDGTGRLTHFRLTHSISNHFFDDIQSKLEDAFVNPFGAFPEKLWQIMFGEKTAFGHKILVIGNNESRAVVSFAKLGADVTYIDLSQHNQLQTMEFIEAMDLCVNAVSYQDLSFSSLHEDQFDILYTTPDVSCCTNNLLDLFQNYKRLLKPNGLLVMLDTHPFMNIFHTQKPSDMLIYRKYDDLGQHAQMGKVYWRFSDFTRWIPESGLHLYAFVELQSDYDLYDSSWYSSVKERLDDKDKLSEIQNNPLTAVPRWLVTFALNKE